MPHLTRLTGILGAAALLAGCNYHATINANDPALNAEAEQHFKDIAASRDDAVVRRMSSENSADQVRAQLPMLRSMIPAGETPDPEFVGAEKTTSNEGQFYSLRQTYPYPDRTALVDTTFKKEGEEWMVRSFNINVRMRPAAAPPQVKAAETPPHSG